MMNLINFLTFNLFVDKYYLHIKVYGSFLLYLYSLSSSDSSDLQKDLARLSFSAVQEVEKIKCLMLFEFISWSIMNSPVA